MRKLILIICLVGSVTSFCSCNKDTRQKKAESEKSNSLDSAFVRGEECDVTINGVHFTKSVNDAASSLLIEDNGRVIFTAKEKSDYFSDPNGKLSNTTAPILLKYIDNTKPFTITAKVTPEFTKDGLYNAGVLYVYVNDSFFQKHCFEQDERGKHRIVTVQTVGTSDDSNHDIVEQPYAYMKISSDTHTIASYYSLDNENWQMVRLYENNYPSKIWVGISTQCPIGEGSKAVFEDISINEKSVSDFRLGI
jgi:regulation of enolase protein 1 (concanavalin A-like superfamily)